MRSLFLKLMVLGTVLTLMGSSSGWAAPVMVSVVDFNDNDGGFTVVTTNAPPGPWTWSDATGTWSCFDSPDCLTAPRSSRLNSLILTVVTPGILTVTVDHRYSWEADTTRWDGGQIRMSVNGGAYTNLPDALFTAEGYNNTIGGAAVPGSEIPGQRAFTAESTGYAGTNFIQTEILLGPFNVDDTVAIQFLAAWDDCSQGTVPNWEVDRVIFDPPLEDRRSAPVFTDATQPADTAIFQGRSGTLQAFVFGVPVPTLQWYKDDLPLENQTASTYTIPFATPGVDDGDYYVVANNSVGSVTSRVATVTVTPDTEGPLWVRGVALANGSLLLSWSEVMSNFYDPFIVFVYETANPAKQFFLADNVLTNGTNLTFITVDPNFDPEPLTAGVNYSIYIGGGSFKDQFGNDTSQSEPNEWEAQYGPGIIRSLGSTLCVMTLDAVWKANWEGVDLGPAATPPRFYDLLYDDSGWGTRPRTIQGPGLLGTETAALPAPGIQTAVPPQSTSGNTTYYRTRFSLPGRKADVLGLKLRTVLDDSAIVYLNGTEVQRIGGLVDPITFASQGRTVGDAVLEGPFTLPIDALVDGQNLLAAEVHQAGATSSDVVWGAEVCVELAQIILEAPVITTPPVSPGTLQERDRLSLTVVAEGTPPLRYQWSQNGTPIDGATNASYSVASATETNSGSYTVTISNSGGSTSSTPVTVTVLPDLTRPRLVFASALLNPTQILLRFSEPIQSATAIDVANYTVELRGGGGPLAVLSATLSNTNVTLTTDPRLVDNYQITIRNLQDTALAQNVIDPNPTVANLPTEVILADTDVIGEWFYDDSGADLGTAWKDPGYIPVDWLNGIPLFYGKRGTPGAVDLTWNTVLSLSNKTAVPLVQLTTIYFRGNIPLTADQLANAQLKFQYILDDGAVFYVNGTEALRVGMPSGTILSSTVANRTQGNDMRWETPASVPSAPFQAGNNLVAVEVHQVNLTSSDIAFALRLVGTQESIQAALRITGISIETAALGPLRSVIIRHNGASAGVPIYVQEATALAPNPADTVWTTRPNGPHASPYNAGPPSGARFFRLKDRP